jgi:Domain of unknown function (DUF5134)
MAGPSWLANILAAVMIATAAYCFSRLAAAWRWQRRTDYDVDGVHILMGVAMAGMLVPRLNPFWDSGWEVIFAAAAAWFGWQTIRGYRNELAVGRRWVAHHLQHVVACGAMLYMFLAVAPARTGSSGSGMSMGGSAGSAATFPTLALVLTLVLVGYVIWNADGLTSLAPVAALRAMAVPLGAVAARALAANTPSPAGTEAAGADVAGADAAGGDAAAGGAATQAAGAKAEPHAEQPHAKPPMSPRLAACCEIAMGLTMGYMLITML